MADIKKPLHPYEQSMLLVAMLFDRKNLPGILKFFPDKQSERMHIAKEKFLKLPRDERMAQIVFELRRLLLVDEHSIDWIHPSWIEDALAKEPPYLQAIILKAIASGTNKKAIGYSNQKIPLPLVFSTFIDQLTKTPQKIAIYDPVLMRLQSLKNEAQEENFAIIGQHILCALKQVLNAQRFMRYLQRRGYDEVNFLPEITYKNPFTNEQLKRQFLHQLIISKDKDCSILAGIIAVAFYLFSHKHQWQRTIALGLNQKFGSRVENIIHQLSSTPIKDGHLLLASLLVAAIDQIRR